MTNRGEDYCPRKARKVTDKSNNIAVPEERGSLTAEWAKLTLIEKRTGRHGIRYEPHDGNATNGICPVVDFFRVFRAFRGGFK